MTVGYDYIAARPLYIGFVRAFNPGQPVPDTTVTSQGWVVGTDVVAVGSPVQSFQPWTPRLPDVGTFTYDSYENVLTDNEGMTYTYNSNGTVHTISDGTTTRTFAYNANGTIAGVA